MQYKKENPNKNGSLKIDFQKSKALHKETVRKATSNKRLSIYTKSPLGLRRKEFLIGSGITQITSIKNSKSSDLS